jgi:hypothetical protein
LVQVAQIGGAPHGRGQVTPSQSVVAGSLEQRAPGLCVAIRPTAQ